MWSYSGKEGFKKERDALFTSILKYNFDHKNNVMEGALQTEDLITFFQIAPGGESEGL